MTWRVELSARARKALLAAQKTDRTRILFKLWELKSNPRPPGCVKLKGSPYRRVRQGDWRVIYWIDEAERQVTVLLVLRRDESTYGGLH